MHRHLCLDILQDVADFQVTRLAADMEKGRSVETGMLGAVNFTSIDNQMKSVCCSGDLRWHRGTLLVFHETSVAARLIREPTHQAPRTSNSQNGDGGLQTATGVRRNHPICSLS